MKLVKHFYYPYYYIEKFNGSILILFFINNITNFKEECDLFLKKIIFTVNIIKKSKKITNDTSSNNFININISHVIDNFFTDFFLKNAK